MYELTLNLIMKAGLSGKLSEKAASAAVFLFLLSAALLLKLISRKILNSIIGGIVSRTRTQWDDLIVKRGFFKKLLQLVPVVFLYITLHIPFKNYPQMEALIARVLLVFIIGIIVNALDALLNSVNDIYRTFEISKGKPIKGYLQVLKIIIFGIGILLMITTLINKSPLGILSGIGALSAVFLLVFKDSLMGVVSSIQLSANEMIKIGDWIEMPQFNADGDVIDITMQTVMVQNWDKTITSIPIYSLISGSFKNWRGMSESGGRRIKRAINIDMYSIKFCNKEMLEKFKRYRHLSEYLERKEKEIEKNNETLKKDNALLINGRNLTNIGTFRAYLERYLRNHPAVNTGMTFIVRQLPPGPEGLPIEIYLFCKEQAWEKYEGIQADIFDHILAVLPHFELRVFQKPGSSDLRQIFGVKDQNTVQV